MLTKEKLVQYYDENTTGCWIWNRSCYAAGYGRFNGEAAHRRVYRLLCGNFPEGLFVLHKCDTPACVNPEHLFLGTQKDNLQDMARKGRLGKSKLTAGLIPQIREAVTRKSVAQIARDYKVSRGAIESILDNRSWTHAK